MSATAPHPVSVALLMVFLMAFSAGSSAQSSPIDDIRDEILESLGPHRLGAGYSAMINFAASPDISAATFYPDDETGSTLKIYKLPYRHVFNLGNEGWRPFIQALVSYQTLESDFEFSDDESIETKWAAYSGSLSGGVEIPITGDLTLLPTVNTSLVRLENTAKYFGPLTNIILKPALSGVLIEHLVNLISADVNSELLATFILR